MQTRILLVCGLAALCVAGVGRAAPGSTQSLLAQLNALRATHLLPPLTADAQLDEVAAFHAHPKRACPLSSRCDSIETGDSWNWQALYQALGGNRRLAVIQDRSGFGFGSDNPWARGAASDPQLLAVALDPRVRAIAFDGDEAALVAYDDGPLAQRLIDAVPAGFGALLPAAPATPRLDLRRGRVWQQVPAQVSPGVPGAVYLSPRADSGEAVPVGFGQTYRINTETGAFAVRTPAFPARWRERGFTFGATSGADRALVLRNVRSYTPFYRQIIDDLDGTITVVVSRAGCTGDGGPRGVSCTALTPTGGTVTLQAAALHDRRFSRFAEAHELGHLVDFLGLDPQGRAAFKKLFRSSPRWRACFPDGRKSRISSGCVPDAEILADQFAFYATGRRQTRSGYGDPPLASRAAFERVLRAYYACRITGAPGLIGHPFGGTPAR